VATNKQDNVLRDAFNGVRHIIYFSIGLSLVHGILKLAGPLFMILIFDRVLPSRSEATLVVLLMLVVVVIAMMALIDYSRRRILARFGAQFQERVEDHIFSSTARSVYFARSGSKPAAGLNEVDQLRSFFHSGSLIVILDFMWSPVFLAVLFVIDPIIGWVVVAGLAILALINTMRVSLDKGRDERQSESKNSVNELRDALLVSRHVIESQQMMGAYNKRWLTARRASRDAAVELKDRSAWFSILSSKTAMLIQYTTLAAGAYLTIEGKLTVGAMVASMYLARHVFYPAESFLKQVPNIQEAIANWKILDSTLSKTAAPTATPAGPAVLSLSSVKARCPMTKNQLVRNVSVEVAPGTSIEIVGGGGSGKTILAETLIGRFPRNSGKILLGAIDVERLSITDALDTFGYVPQRIDFISGTIEENIAGLDPDPAKDRLVHVARLARVHDKIVSLPDGYLTRIDAVGSIFSKSERHQLALARALYPDPKVLIVDEPDTTFRDALSRDLHDEITDYLARGGILIILNRVALKRFHPTRRFTLDEGVLKEVKSPQTTDIKTDIKVVRVHNG
jgi:ATP-binding cassette subfamily C protein